MAHETLEPRHLLAVTLAADSPTMDEGSGSALLSAVLTEVRNVDVSVDLAVSGSATAGFDYALAPMRIVVPAGSLSATATVTAIPDAKNEGDESIVVEISEVTNDTEDGDQRATILIIDDDPPPVVTLSVNDGAISENGGAATLTAALSTVSGLPVTVDLRFSGTAIAGIDFLSSTQIEIPAGSLLRTVSITTVQDSLDEDDESVVVRITNVTNGTVSGTQQFLTTILDDDPQPSISLAVDPPTIFENGGAGQVSAELSAVSGRDVTVALEYDGTATEGVDYLGDTQIVIPRGSRSGSAAIEAIEDEQEEPAETIVVRIASATHATVSGSPVTTLTLIDDDLIPSLAIAAASSTIAEDGGLIELTAELSSITTRPVTVGLGYTGTAAANLDYLAVPTIVIPAGERAVTVNLPSIVDSFDEANETVIIDVVDLVNAIEFETQRVTVRILDDDLAPAVNLSVDHGEISEAAGVATVTASLSTASSFNVTIALATTGTADRGEDYTVSGTVIEIPAGSTTGSITLTALQDDFRETEESVVIDVIVISNGREVGDQRTITTILDDDELPAVALEFNRDTIVEAGGTATVTATLSAVSGIDVVVGLGYAGTAEVGVDYSPFSAGRARFQSAAVVTQTLTLSALGMDTPATVVAQGTIQWNVTLQPDSNDIAQGTAAMRLRGFLPQEFAALGFAGLPFDLVPTAGSLQISGATVESGLTVQVFEPTRTSAIAEFHIQQRGGFTADRVQVPFASGSVFAPAASDDVTNVALGDNVVGFELPPGSVVGTANDRSLATLGAPTTQLVIPAGSLSASASITAIQDDLAELPESVRIQVAQVVNGIESADNQTTTTILDDDRLPSISLGIDQSRLPETDGVAVVTAEVSEIVGRPVVVALSYEGIAELGVDYLASDTQILIPAGVRSGSVTLAAVSDGLDEPDEPFAIAVAGLTNAAPEFPTPVVATIVDDDPAPLVSIVLDSSTIVETGGLATVTASLSALSSRDVTIELAYSGTATPQLDYVPSAGQIVIAAGTTSGDVTIQSADDPLDEPQESLIIDVVSIINGLATGPSQFVVNILDDDLPPHVEIQVDTSSIAEAAGTATVVASLSSATSRDVTVDFAYSGTATRQQDYAVESTSVVIPAGSRSGSVTLTAVQDVLDESDETVLVDISQVTNAVELGDQQLRITIADDDLPPMARLSVNHPAMTESGGSATVTATLSEVSSLNVTIEIGLGGSATLGSDYEISWNQIVIAAGQLTGTTTLTALPDAISDPQETLLVEIAAIANAVDADRQPFGIAVVEAELASVQGRSFHDLNMNGQRDAGESYLNGWRIELLDESGQVIAVQHTREMDRDGDEEIDPETEQGWYRFFVVDGTYALREVQRTGWRLTLAVDDLAARAYELDQRFDFFSSGNFFENWGGQGERWLQAANDQNRWYFITLDGQLQRWDGASGTPLGTLLAGEQIATLDSGFHEDPRRLIDVPLPTQGQTISVTAGQSPEDMNFGNLQLASVSGRSFHDRDGDGEREPTEEYLNGWTIELIDGLGQVVATQQTRDLDLNQDGRIDPESERGWYRFDDLDPGEYSTRQIPQEGWRRTAPVDRFAQLAFVLDQQFEFFSSGDFFENFAGAGEKWFQSATAGRNWYYILPNGYVYEWDRVSGISSGIPLNGELIATLNPSFHDDPTRLINAQPDEGLQTVTLEGGESADGRDFGNLRLAAFRSLRDHSSVSAQSMITAAAHSNALDLRAVPEPTRTSTSIGDTLRQHRVVDAESGLDSREPIRLPPGQVDLALERLWAGASGSPTDRFDLLSDVEELLEVRSVG